MSATPERVLAPPDLNRATLARQLLLARAPLEPVDAISTIVALQAQEPASPYLALWSRLANFDAESLRAAISARQVVKATLMRVTLHLVGAADYSVFWAAHAPSFRRTRALALRLDTLGVDPARLDELAEAALAYAVEPRSNGELTAHLSRLGGPLGDRAWWAVRAMAPLVHAAGHLEAAPAWSYGRRPAYVAARMWTDGVEMDADRALDTLVLRYLAGFGPATVGDVAIFTRLERSRVRASVERLRPTLRIFADLQGGELVDIPDGLIPDRDVEAPVRFLPMWDSVLLAYEDRSRLIPPAYRSMVIRTNGDVLPTFLVDGRVAGVWRADIVGGQTVIIRYAFGSVPRKATAELDAEAAALARFVEPHEPEVYRRYRRWWTKLVP